MKDYTFKQTKKTTDETSYTVTIPYARFEKEKDEVFEKLAQDIKLPGFRPGKGPKDVIEEKLGMKLYSEALNQVIPEITYEIIVKEKLNPISAPEYDVKHIDKTKGIEYTFTFTEYPEVKLGDFSKITVKKDEITVTDKDIEEVIKNVVRSSLKPEELKEFEKKSSTQKKDEKEVDFELSDKLVEKLGYEEEKTLADLKKSVKKRLEEMKKSQIESNYHNAIIAKAIELSDFTIPKVLLEQEIKNLEKDYTSRLEELQLNIEEYLKSQNTSLEEKRKEWRKIAEERIGSDLILITIANKENVLPTDEDVQKEIDKIEDESVRKQYESENARSYVKTVITKQRGAEKLIEKVDKKDSKKAKNTKK